MREQQIDFGAQLVIVRARVIEKVAALGGIDFECFGKHALYLLPTFRCRCCLPPVAKPAAQPQFRRIPFALGGGWRDAHDFRNLFDRQSTKEAQLDDLRLLRIESREFI